MNDVTLCPVAGSNLTLTDPAINENPYETYARLLEEAPVYRDPATGFYIVTRYEDVRRIHMDTVTFSTAGFIEAARRGVDGDRAERMRDLFREKGWVPTGNLTQYEGAEHQDKRNVWLRALGIGKVKQLEPFIRETAAKLVDAFVDDGQCEFISAFASSLPLTVISTQLGAKAEDVPMIKVWLDRYIDRLGMMQSEENAMLSVEAEIEAQHYFKPIMDEMRRNPDGTVLSDLLNTTFKDGSKLTDEQFFGHMMPDLFAGGSDTTASALGSGMMLLCKRPELAEKLKAEPDKYMRGFIEEALRLESPVQMLFRVTTVDVDVAGTIIPAGSVVGTSYGAANRDPRKFACPADLDPQRPQIGAHQAFGGGGVHTCIGAPLARLELQCGFEELLRRFEDFRSPDDLNDYAHWPNMVVRTLRQLNITFSKRV